MTDDEFKELNTFGEKIEKKTNNKNDLKREETKVDKKVKKQNIIILLRKIKKSIFVYFRFFLIKMFLLSKNIKLFFYKKIGNISFKNKRNIGYKIVETKKQKRNKVIITRKRMPITISNLSKNKIKKPCIYYYKINLEKKTKVKKYSKLKDSVWDFPLKK